MSIRLGADPEIFLQNEHGKLISSIGYINAGKEAPLQIPDMPKGFTLQEDNVTLEYGIPPAANADEFVQYIQGVMVKSMEYVPGLSFSKLSCAIFPEDQMQHPLAHVFGCEPDFNAWTFAQNPRPRPTHEYMRSAGGHIHVETDKPGALVIRSMDLYLGVPSVLMDEGVERKKLYGKAGAFRKKSYGVEYRTLSNFWVFDEKLIRWAWRNTERAVDMTGTFDIEMYADKILRAINDNSKHDALELIEEFKLEVV